MVQNCQKIHCSSKAGKQTNDVSQGYIYPGHCTLLEFVSIIHCRKRDPVLNGLLTSEGKHLIWSSLAEAGLFEECVHWALIWYWRWICNFAKNIQKLIPCWFWPAVLPASVRRQTIASNWSPRLVYIHYELICCWTCNLAKKLRKRSRVDRPALSPASVTKEGGPGIEDIAAPQPLNWWQFN